MYLRYALGSPSACWINISIAKAEKWDELMNLLQLACYWNSSFPDLLNL